MDQVTYELELLAYAEKIALAKLEVSKAEERVRELEFEKARYMMEVNRQLVKSQQQSVKQS